MDPIVIPGARNGRWRSAVDWRRLTAARLPHDDTDSVPKDRHGRTRTNGCAVRRISAGCPSCPDNAEIHGGGRYPKIAGKISARRTAIAGPEKFGIIRGRHILT